MTNTTIQRSIHYASNREKRDGKGLQNSDTWQNVKEGKLSALRHKTRPLSVCGTATRSSTFFKSMAFFFLVTSTIDSKAIQVTIAKENGCSLPDARPRPRLDRKTEFFSLRWQTSNERYSSSLRRILKNKVSPFRLGKDVCYQYLSSKKPC